MNAQIKKLLKSLDESFKGEPWYGISLIEKLKTIDFELVNEVPVGLSNSIAKLVQHIINWRGFAIEKLKGNAQFDIEINSIDDWPNVFIDSEDRWLNLICRLNDTQNEMMELLNSKEDSFLEEQVPGRKHDFRFLIEGMTQHDVYHLGQIGLVAKMAGVKIASRT